MLKIIVALLVAVACSAFESPKGQTATRRTHRLFISYKEQLEKAKLARQHSLNPNQGGAAPAVQAHAAAIPQPQPVPRALPKKQRTGGTNGLPFDDEMYDHMQYVISTLSARMRSSAPLSREKVAKFEDAVNAILYDLDLTPQEWTEVNAVAERDAATQASSAETYLPGAEPAVPQQQTRTNLAPPPGLVSPPSRSSAAIRLNPSATGAPVDNDFYIPELGEEDMRSIDEADPTSPFAPLHGLKSSWQIKGMEDMSTEEYYAEITRRNLQMKLARKSSPEYSREASRDYEAQLNLKNRVK